MNAKDLGLMIAGVAIVAGLSSIRSRSSDSLADPASKKPQKDIGRFVSVEEAVAAGFRKEDFRPATINETMGPIYKPILWVASRPYVRR